jgi:hypothetical protein
MGLRVRFLDGEKADQTIAFGDDVGTIVIGRDPAICQIVFPSDDSRVGRQHCALKRVLGHYRLVLDTEHRVLLGGKPAHDEQELDPLSILQVGPGGPRIEVQVEERQGLTRTVFQGVRRPQVGEIVETAARTAKANRKIAAVAMALTIAVAAAGWWMLTRTEQKAESTAQRVETLAQRQGTVLDEVRTKVSGLEEQLTKVEPAMKDVLKRAAGSVYLVLVSKDDGTQVAMATAWVVAPKLLATNAHVAELLEKIPEGHRLIARSNSTPPKDHAVSRVEIHPGYEEFSRIWAEYAPARKVIGEKFEKVQPIPACDVALLHVEDAEQLAAPLALADPERIRALGSPETVGFAGYPTEGMAAGGVNVRQPEPTVQVGHITAVTDFFLGKDISGNGQLVQHALPVAGGASGSPILDARGQVVAVVSAANVTMTLTGRVPMGVGVNFAQRADLVQELLEGRAAEAQAPRSRSWEEDIKQFFSGQQVFAEASKRMLQNLLDQWVGTSGKTPKRLGERGGTLGAVDPNGRHVARVKFEKLPPGPLLLVALPATEADVDLYVFKGATEDLVGRDEQADWWPTVPLLLGAESSLDLMVVGPREGLGFTLHAFTAE